MGGKWGGGVEANGVGLGKDMWYMHGVLQRFQFAPPFLRPLLIEFVVFLFLA